MPIRLSDIPDDPQDASNLALEAPRATKRRGIRLSDIPGEIETPKKIGLIERFGPRAAAGTREAIRTFSTPSSKDAGGDFLENYNRGFQAPEESETFQNEALRKFNDSLRPEAGTAERFVRGIPTSIAGFTQDVLTNPLETGLLFAGRPIFGGIQTLGKVATKVPFGFGKTAQGIGNVLSKVATKPLEDIPGDIARPFRGIGRSIEKIKNPPIKFEQRLAGRTQQIKSEFESKTKNIESKLESDLDIVDKNFQRVSEFESRKAQRDLSKSFKVGKKNYEAKLEAKANQIDESTPFTRKEINQLADDALKEADELFIDEGGAPIRVLQKIKERYGVKPVELDTLGRPVIGNLSNANEIVSLKDVLKAKRAVDSAITPGAQSGIKSFTSDDIVSSIFNKKIGQAIAERDNSFGQLQGQYGELAERMKDAYRLFKIGKGSKFTKTGTELLKRISSGKSESGEIEAVERLIKGDSLSPAISDVTSSPKNIFYEGQKRKLSAGKDISNLNLSKEESLKHLAKIESKRSRFLAQKQGRQKIAKIGAVGTALIGVPEVGRKIFRL